jgi:hypothetical protein
MYVVGHCKITNISPPPSNPFHQPQYRCRGSHTLRHSLSVRLPWTNDRLVAEALPTQHKGTNIYTVSGILFLFMLLFISFVLSFLSIVYLYILFPLSLTPLQHKHQNPGGIQTRNNKRSTRFNSSQLSYLSLTYSAITEFKNSHALNGIRIRDPRNRGSTGLSL